MRAQLNTHSWEEVLHARGSTSGRQQPHARAVTPPRDGSLQMTNTEARLLL